MLEKTLVVFVSVSVVLARPGRPAGKVTRRLSNEYRRARSSSSEG